MYPAYPVMGFIPAQVSLCHHLRRLAVLLLLDDRDETTAVAW
jgi:hypothetical protein